MVIKIIKQFVAVLLCVSFISFLLVYLAPGDPAESILAAQGIPYSPELLAQKRLEFGLNGSFIEQYAQWLLRILHGDFGISYQSGAPVIDQLLFYFPNSLILAFWVLVATLLISVPLALYSAYHPQSAFDKIVLVVTGFFNAIPSFVLGILAMILFSVSLHLLPVQATANEFGLILPIMTLATTMSTRYIPQLRTAFLDVLQSSHVEGARGRGLSEWHILVYEVLYDGLPFLLTLVSFSLGSLLGGVTIIENLFSWPGVGKLMVSVASNRDYPLIQGIVLVSTFGVLVVNAIAQLLQIWLNPRLKYKKQLQQEGI